LSTFEWFGLEKRTRVNPKTERMEVPLSIIDLMMLASKSKISLISKKMDDIRKHIKFEHFDEGTYVNSPCQSPYYNEQSSFQRDVLE
jgi:hypothetical protein